MKKIYCISGLGADKRVFQYLHIDNAELHYIDWIEPLQKEKLSDYTCRLKEQIQDEDPIILAVSFGGLIAVELSKIISSDKIILISSISSFKQMPLIYRLAGLMRIYKLVPSFIFNKYNLLISYMFGVRSISSKKLLKNIICDTNVSFAKWSLGNLLQWKHDSPIQNLYHIHGSKDRLFPLKKNDSSVIKDGSHFMIVDRANEVSEAINRLIKGG